MLENSQCQDRFSELSEDVNLGGVCIVLNLSSV